MRVCFIATAASGILILTTVGFVGNAKAEDEPIFGRSMMTMEERNQYRSQVRDAENEEQRVRIRAQHRSEMQRRADQHGVKLPHVSAPRVERDIEKTEADNGKVRARDLMSEKQKLQHRDEMKRRTTKEERERVREEKHEEMKKSAEDQDVGISKEPSPMRDGRGHGSRGRGRDRGSR